MPIITSSSKLLFCEGKSIGSYDYALLDKLLASSGPQIVPLGSKYGFNARIEGYCLACSEEPRYIAFRDRDFDLKPPDKVDLLLVPGAKPVWTTYRACLESYLIDPNLFHEFWQIKHLGPTWKFGLPPTVDFLHDVFTSTAKRIAPYQAARWALSEIKPETGWPARIRTNWLENGEMPKILSYEACLLEATKLVKAYLLEVKDISVEKLDNVAKDYLQLFSAKEFFDTKRYLIWFHGKDLIKSILTEFKFQSLFGVYMNWGLENLNFNAYPDLLALKQKCEEL